MKVTDLITGIKRSSSIKESSNFDESKVRELVEELKKKFEGDLIALRPYALTLVICYSYRFCLVKSVFLIGVSYGGLSPPRRS